MGFFGKDGNSVILSSGIVDEECWNDSFGSAMELIFSMNSYIDSANFVFPSRVRCNLSFQNNVRSRSPFFSIQLVDGSKKYML